MATLPGNSGIDGIHSFNAVRTSSSSYPAYSLVPRRTSPILQNPQTGAQGYGIYTRLLHRYRLPSPSPSPVSKLRAASTTTTTI